MKNLWKAYTELPPIARGTIAVVAVGTVAFVGWNIYKAVRAARDSADDKDELNQTRNELDQLQNAGVRQSYPDSQYQTYANGMADALNYGRGCLTDGATIAFTISALKNDVDWLKLNQAFGTREIIGCMLAPSQTIGMTAAIKWKVGNYYDLNKILKNKGIRYQI